MPTTPQFTETSLLHLCLSSPRTVYSALAMPLALTSCCWPIGNSSQHVPGGTSSQLTDLWGSAPDDIWAVGYNGTTVHFDGVAWTEVDNPVDEDLMAIWGISPIDVWAVGGGQIKERVAGRPESRDGVVIHWNGDRWETVERPTDGPLQAVWGEQPHEIWAAGSVWRRPEVFRFNGSTWDTVPIQPDGGHSTVYGLWGSSSTDVWAVGGTGLVMRWNGTEWTTVNNDIHTELRGVWGPGPNNVWIYGDSTTVYHYDGQNWTHIYCPPGPYHAAIVSVWGTGANDMWLVDHDRSLFHWDGQRCTHEETLPLRAPEALWSGGDGKLWIGGWSPEMMVREL